MGFGESGSVVLIEGPSGDPPSSPDLAAGGVRGPGDCGEPRARCSGSSTPPEPCNGCSTIPQRATTSARTPGRTSRGATGANVWGLMSLDAELCVPTSTPSSDYWGGRRVGANLFAESLVCLDARNGRAAVALPGGAPRRVGLRPVRTAEPRDDAGREIDAVAQVAKHGFDVFTGYGRAIRAVDTTTDVPGDAVRAAVPDHAAFQTLDDPRAGHSGWVRSRRACSSARAPAAVRTGVGRHLTPGCCTCGHRKKPTRTSCARMQVTIRRSTSSTATTDGASLLMFEEAARKPSKPARFRLSTALRVAIDLNAGEIAWNRSARVAPR